jgi:hypothetical protein
MCYSSTFSAKIRILVDPPGWGLDARLTTLLCKKVAVTKSKEVKTGCNLTESSKEGYGQKKGSFTIVVVLVVVDDDDDDDDDENISFHIEPWIDNSSRSSRVRIRNTNRYTASFGEMSWMDKKDCLIKVNTATFTRDSLIGNVHIWVFVRIPE